MASTSGRRHGARLSRVERPAGIGGQALLRVSAVLLEVARDQSLDGGPVVVVEVAAADKVVGKGRALSRVHAWNAATSWTWSIRPFWSASNPNSKLRSAVTEPIVRQSPNAGGSRGLRGPNPGSLGPLHSPGRLNYHMTDNLAVVPGGRPLTHAIVPPSKPPIYVEPWDSPVSKVTWRALRKRGSSATREAHAMREYALQPDRPRGTGWAAWGDAVPVQVGLTGQVPGPRRSSSTAQGIL